MDNKITTDINENVNLNGTVSITNENGVITQILYMSCSLNADSVVSNIDTTVYNKELFKANIQAVTAEVSKFRERASKRAGELGCIIL
ncbi:hypothetical protein [Clostridium baratii]|uniref:hypothetical protein n=1 Tax=Clostridium baratii TaxID=1561 RepID=UPI003D799FC8